MLLDIHLFQELLGLTKIKALMIKVNVITNNNDWYSSIKDPENYIFKKIKKINKSDKYLFKKKFYCTLLLSDNKEIKYLNNKFRKKNKSTDVLSFPFQEKKELINLLKSEKEIYLGDIIINLNKIKKKKIKLFNSEFDRLWIHGLAHLLGHDHKKEKDFLKMNQVEKKFLNLINA
jgi:probable rRNA maturation factor